MGDWLVKYSGIMSLVVTVIGGILVFSNGLVAAQGKVSSLEDRIKAVETNVDQIRANLSEHMRETSSVAGRSSILEAKMSSSQSSEAVMSSAIADGQRYAASLDKRLERLEASLATIGPVVVELSKRPMATIDPRQQRCVELANEIATGWAHFSFGGAALSEEEKKDRLAVMHSWDAHKNRTRLCAGEVPLECLNGMARFISSPP